MPLLTLQSPVLYEYAPRQYNVNVATTSPNIVLQGNVGNIFANKLDSMYLLKGAGNTWAFRTNGTIFDGINTTLFYPQFAYSLPTVTGPYTIIECYHEVKPVYGRTLCMIGDSITWHTCGSYFRSYLRDQGLQYDFAGSHIDTFNFRHEGEGGNGTLDVLNRINKISNSTHYFILLGTNDITLTPQQTVDNLINICNKLTARQACKIFLSTLLPRVDNLTYSQRAVDTNILLRSTTLPTNVKLIDMYNELILYVSAWQSYTIGDGLHPNLAMYNIITTKLTPLLEF